MANMSIVSEYAYLQKYLKNYYFFFKLHPSSSRSTSCVRTKTKNKIQQQQQQKKMKKLFNIYNIAVVFNHIIIIVLICSTHNFFIIVIQLTIIFI